MKKLPSGQAALNRLLQRYKYKAKKRGFRFLLTDLEATNLFTQPCHYCGTEPNQCVGHTRMNGQFQYNGIDRVDNALDYTPDNVVTACGDCNRAKFNKGPEAFREWIRRVYQHQNG